MPPRSWWQIHAVAREHPAESDSPPALLRLMPGPAIKSPWRAGPDCQTGQDPLDLSSHRFGQGLSDRDSHAEEPTGSSELREVADRSSSGKRQPGIRLGRQYEPDGLQRVVPRLRLWEPGRVRGSPFLDVDQHLTRWDRPPKRPRSPSQADLWIRLIGRLGIATEGPARRRQERQSV